MVVNYNLNFKAYILFLVSIFYAEHSFSQNHIFEMYRFECLEFFNINIVKPKTFKVIDGRKLFRVNEKKTTAGIYSMVLQTKTKDCLILFPHFYNNRQHEIAAKNMVFSEIKAALDLNINDKTIELDTAKYVKMLTGGNMENYFNADTVFIFKIPLPEPYEGIYKYCTGVNVIKKGHPSAMIKILFTEEGKKNEDNYMNVLFNSIHYSNIAPAEIDDKKRAKVRKKFKSKFIFHRRKYSPSYFDK